ncbi:MAG TPA: hypothetical protein VHP11_00130 [Tepidisphaeraceae bacterium]|nr:hypothetical protein [Tepidisphaeraceae bacterium]
MARWNQRFRAAIFLVVLLGIACRVGLFLSRQSFWGDEAYLLLNLRHYSLWRILTGRLDYVSSTQAAPPLFLLILKYVMQYLGSSEYSMRLLPLVCSSLALPLYAILALRLLPPAVAFWPVAFLAFTDVLVVQAATLKQYSGDALVVVLLLLIAFPRGFSSPSRRLLSVALVASVTLWFSHPTIFLFAAVSLALLPHFIRGPVANRLRYCLLNLPVALSFFALYFFSIRAQRDPFLDAYWSECFIDFAQPLRIPRFIVENTWELFTYPVRPLGGLLLIPAAFGIVSLHRSRKNELLTALLAPIVLVFLAGATHQYPYTAGRITIFLIPCEFLLAAFGIPAMRRILPQPFHHAPWILPAGILILMLSLLPSRSVFRDHSGHLRSAVEHLVAHRQPTEPIYILGQEESAVFRCYHPVPDSLTYFDLPLSTYPTDDAFWLLFRANRLRKLPKDAVSPLVQPHATLDTSASLDPPSGGAALRFVKCSAPATRPAN